MKVSGSVLGFTSLVIALLVCVYLNYLQLVNPQALSMGIQRVEVPLEGGVLKSTFLKDGSSLNYLEAVKLLASGDELFISLINTAIMSHPSNAVFWECPPFAVNTVDNIPFEFVLIPSSDLESIITDISSFREHFAKHRNSVVGIASPNEVITFKSLGGDASLVVPCPADLNNLNDNPAEMAHLALFIRHASVEHRVELWRTVGRTVLEVLQNSAANRRFWLSTSGLGVSWLHVRIDTVPKYYHYEEYKNIPLLAPVLV